MVKFDWDFSEKSMERFWANVDKSGECWIWTASVAKGGYGQLMRGGQNHKAHKMSYVYHKGDTGENHVLHSCDNPRCVNPDHLSLGTAKDNVLDCISKGRFRRGDPLIGKENPSVKVKNIPVSEIIDLYESGMPAYKIAPMFGIGRSTVHNIANGRHWSNDKPAERKFGRSFSKRQKRTGKSS